MPDVTTLTDTNVAAARITNGMDMVAVYMRQRWPGQLSDLVVYGADIVVRPAEIE
jgi:hypothetical protein